MKTSLNLAVSSPKSSIALIATILLAFIPLPSLTAQNVDTFAKPELQILDIQGEWKAIGNIEKGKIVEVDQSLRYRIGKEAIEIVQSDGSVEKIEYRHVVQNGKNILATRMGEQTSEMIFGFDATRLWICHSGPDGKPPESPVSDEETSLMVFQRMDHEPSQKLIFHSALDHAYGNTGIVDLKKSRELTLQAAASEGVVAKCWLSFARNFNLAGFFDEHETDHNAFKKLYPDLKRLADAGDNDARLVIGLALFHGFAVDTDKNLAISFFEAAAKQGHSHSAYWLGRLESQSPQAIGYLRMAVAFGNAGAMASMAANYHSGRGVKADLNKSRKWYRASAVRHYPKSLATWGMFVEEHDTKEAFRLYQLAAEANHPIGLWKLGQCYQAGTACQPDLEKAIAYFKRAIDLGSMPAKYDLGYIHFDNREFDTALHLFHEAAEEGSAPSMLAIGIMNEEGYGVKRDVERAKAWYEKAVAGGNPLAKRRLDRLNQPQLQQRSSADGGSPSYRDPHVEAQRAAERATRRFRQQLGRGF